MRGDNFRRPDGSGNFGGFLALATDYEPVIPGDLAMLYYTLVFLVVALIAGALGFGGLASASAGIARILFGLFLVLFLISLVMQLLGRA